MTAGCSCPDIDAWECLGKSWGVPEYDRHFPFRDKRRSTPLNTCVVGVGHKNRGAVISSWIMFVQYLLHLKLHDKLNVKEIICQFSVWLFTLTQSPNDYRYQCNSISTKTLLPSALTAVLQRKTRRTKYSRSQVKKSVGRKEWTILSNADNQGKWRLRMNHWI